ncbi:hypothetical protein M8J75_000867 [Diaphorina citri]|nr:hypothetical protein M8J75_000867 [Diaphorina citri]
MRQSLNNSQVKWAEQQVVKRRSKRGFLKMPRTVAVTRTKHSYNKGRIALNDPKWPQMWYLNRGHGLDMNVQGAWEEGITGKGVVITILDDGLEKDHPDLIQNYDPLASYDVNSHDDDPMPRYDQVDSNRHGTRCAGEVAATANNSLCSVGIAFHSSVGGVRMLDGDVTDAVEARSLSLNPGHIDIYSASWGPDDDGKTVDGPGELATRAFIEGVTRGREGKGSIFVWASGNGGRDHDNCNCDGYTNSIWTLSTSSATETGQVPWYSEACSSTLATTYSSGSSFEHQVVTTDLHHDCTSNHTATTYSSGSSFEHQVVTTDLHHDCTSNHTGTSASAPLAAGICALALEANPGLTWRDMQHIVVATARPANLRAPDWATNGVGRNVSHSFGYGLMDATAMVRLARQWKTVPEQFKCEASPSEPSEMERPIPAKSSIRLKLDVTECPHVNYLEHVQARVTLSAHRRGDLQIVLVSPAGTRATLLATRPHDSSKAGFNAWPFMSVHSWGEQPFGSWYLEIHNEGRYFGRAMVHLWVLLLYGTNTPPNFAPTPSPVPAVISNLFPTGQPAPGRPKTPKPRKKPNVGGPKLNGGKMNILGGKSDKLGELKNTLSGKGDLKKLGDLKKPEKPELKKSKKPNRNNKNRTGGSARKSLTVYVPKTARPGAILPRGPVSQPEEDVGLIYLAPFPDAPVRGSLLLKYPRVEQLFELPNYSNFDILEASMQLEPKQFPESSLRQTQSTAWSLVLHGTETAPVTLDNKPVLKSPPLTRNISADKASPFPIPDVFNGLGNPSGVGGGGRLSQRTGITSGGEAGAAEFTDAQNGACKLTPVCVECGPGYFLYDGKCTVKCPVGTYQDPIQNLCLDCHYSCKRCTGSTNDQCTLCYPDATLHRSLCVPSILLEDLNTTLWYARLVNLFYVNLALMFGVALYIGYVNWGAVRKYVCRRRGSEVGLTRLRYSTRQEALQLSDSELSSG